MQTLDALVKRVTQLEAKVSKIIQLAKVKTVDANTATVTCILAEDQSETAPLPWMIRHAGNTIEWWLSEVGEQVLVLNLTGVTDMAVVMPALYSTTFPAPDTNPNLRKLVLSDGTAISHDSQNKTLTINTQADVTITANSAAVQCDGDVAINGGNIKFNQGTAGGVVCQSHVCAFTGSGHPQGSTTILGAS